MTRQIALFGLIAMAACASNTRNDEPTTAGQVPAHLQMDEDFIKAAASAGKFEVESSRLALSRQSTGEVTELAQLMIRDHTQANERLEELARSKAVELSNDMMPEHIAKLSQLEQMQGAEFDAGYERIQLEAHQEAISLFQRCAQYCQDPQVREYAASTLPTLQAHLDHVQEAQALLD